MFDAVIVRYAEIFLKSEPVKQEFENRLIESIKRKLGPQIEIKRKRHRLYVKTGNAREAASELAKVFGIRSVSPAVETKADLNEITKASVKLASKTFSDRDSFAVRARRSKDFSFTSKSIEEHVGEKILSAVDCTVDLDDPDSRIYIEVKGEHAYVFAKKMDAVGGLPYTSQGKLVSLISSGIDSPIATYCMMKRGAKMVALHFKQSDEELEDVKKILRKLEEYSACKIKLHVVPWSSVLNQISSEVPGGYACLICKRMMYRVAESLMKKENACGIVTGENVGQVASQTLQNLFVINESTNAPVYRPVAGWDKEEIIDLAREVGTYRLAGGHSCSLAPSTPSTKAKLDEVKEVESDLDIEVSVFD